MATGQRNDPYRSFRFRIEIDGIQTGFSDASGFDATVDVVDYREGTDPTHVRKLSGLTKFGNITLKWGVTDTSMVIYDWHKAGIEGPVQRKNVAIIVVDESGNDKARWEVVNAWPTKVTPPTFNAKGNEVGIETLEIVHEGMKRVK